MNDWICYFKVKDLNFGITLNQSSATTHRKRQLAKKDNTQNLRKATTRKFLNVVGNFSFSGNFIFFIGNFRAGYAASRGVTGSKFRMKSYPLLASSQHVGATAAVSIL